MSTLTTTILIAFIIITIAIFALALGWIITGRSKIQRGMCGKIPTQAKEDRGCGTQNTCSLCHPNDDENKNQ